MTQHNKVGVSNSGQDRKEYGIRTPGGESHSENSSHYEFMEPVDDARLCPLFALPDWPDIVEKYRDVSPADFVLRFGGKKMAGGRHPWPVRDLAEQLHCYPRAASKLGPLHKSGMIYLREPLEQASGYAAAVFRVREWRLDFGERTRMGGKDKDAARDVKERKGDITPLIGDVTGGLGIDTAVWARAGARVCYCERDKKLAMIARHNHRVLGIGDRVTHILGDGVIWLENRVKAGEPSLDLLYIDPSRRTGSHKPANKGSFIRSKANQSTSDHGTSNHNTSVRKTLDQSSSDHRTANQSAASPGKKNHITTDHRNTSHGTAGRRVITLEESEPPVTEIMPLVRSSARQYLLKLSPMLDITHLRQKLPGLQRLMAVSVAGEVKELLAWGCGEGREGVENPDAAGSVSREAVLLDRSGVELFRIAYDDAQMPTETPADPDAPEDPDVHADSDADAAANPDADAYPVVAADSEVSAISEDSEDSDVRKVPGTEPVGTFLFEPDPAILKMDLAGELANRFGLDYVNRATGYLTGDRQHTGFPGRVYRIRETHPWNPKKIKRMLKANGTRRVHIHQRGFPLSVDQLFKVLQCEMGEDAHLIATQDHQGRPVLHVADST